MLEDPGSVGYNAVLSQLYQAYEQRLPKAAKEELRRKGSITPGELGGRAPSLQVSWGRKAIVFQVSWGKGLHRAPGELGQEGYSIAGELGQKHYCIAGELEQKAFITSA